MKHTSILSVLWSTIRVVNMHDSDFLSLTDIAKFKNIDFPADVIKNRLRTKSTIEFLWLRERLYNTDFKLVEFDQFKNEAGWNSFVLNPQKRIDATNAVWLVTKSWRYWWWTYAHKDIALEFATWISVEVKLYLIKDYQRLKENEQKDVNWSVKRLIAKTNYKIHTDSIKENLIPQLLTEREKLLIYPDEADMLNMILFGKTAKQWREENVASEWNMRDYATIEQLIVLSNLESLNAELVRNWLESRQRIDMLNKTAIAQMRSLLNMQDTTFALQ